MPNPSQIRDQRCWKKWKASGAVETFQQAVVRSHISSHFSEEFDELEVRRSYLDFLGYSPGTVHTYAHGYIDPADRSKRWRLM